MLAPASCKYRSLPRSLPIPALLVRAMISPSTGVGLTLPLPFTLTPAADPLPLALPADPAESATLDGGSTDPCPGHTSNASSSSSSSDDDERFRDPQPSEESDAWRAVVPSSIDPRDCTVPTPSSDMCRCFHKQSAQNRPEITSGGVHKLTPWRSCNPGSRTCSTDGCRS